jgi:hypothetical protein
MNKNIISTIIGKKITNIRIESFYLENELVAAGFKSAGRPWG